MFDFNNIGDNAPIIVKVNSYQGTVTTLRDGKVFTKGNILFKFTDSENTANVIDLAESYFKGLMQELRDDAIDLTIRGNLFEQEFFTLAASNNRFKSPKCISNDFNLSTTVRLSALAKANVNLSPKTFPLVLEFYGNDFSHFNLPEYSLVGFTGGPSASRILISSNLSYLEKELRGSAVDGVAFWVNGTSHVHGEGKYIIGCTADNVAQIIRSYIETRYLNPFVSELTLKAIEQLTPAENSAIYTFNRVDPYYFISDRTPITVYVDKWYPVPLHCVSSIGEEQLQADASDILAKVQIQTSLDGELALQSDTLQLKCANNGSDKVAFHVDGNDFSDCLEVNAVPFIYVSSVGMEIDHNGWERGQSYRFRYDIFPREANDKDTVTFSISNSDIAEFRDNMVYIKDEGEFYVIAATAHKQWRRRFVVTFPRIISFDVKSWPGNNTARVDHFWYTDLIINGRVIKQNEYRVEYSNYAKKISVVKDLSSSGVNISALAPGKVKVKFIPTLDETAAITKELQIKPHYKNPAFIFLGILLVIISAVFTLFRSSWCPWLYLISLLPFVIAVFRREQFAKSIILVALAALFGLNWLHENVFCVRKYVTSVSEVSESAFNELLEDSLNRAYDTHYQQSDFPNTFTYYPTSVESWGYCFETNEVSWFNFRKKHNNLYFVHKINATCPDNGDEMIYYITDLITNVRSEGNGEFTHEFEDDLDAYQDLDRLLKDVPLHEESTIPLDTIFDLMGYNKCLSSIDQISADDLKPILSSIAQDLSNKSSNNDNSHSFKAYCSDAVLFIAPRNHASLIYSRNLLYIVFTVQEFKNDTLIKSYYYPYYFIDIVISDNGHPDLDIDNIKQDNIVPNAEEYIADKKDIYVNRMRYYGCEYECIEIPESYFEFS